MYTDRVKFLQTRVEKLREIIARARTAQRQVRDDQSYLTDRDRQQALQQWGNIEHTAQAMLTEIQNTIKTAQRQSQHDALPTDSSATPGQRPMAKNVILTRLDGKRERIATYRGGVVFLHFWATWCRPCVKEIPSLQRLHDRFRTQNFTVLTVSLDARKKDLRRFMRRLALPGPMYFDPGRTVYQHMIGGLEILPRSLLIDTEGRIVRSYAGAHHLASPATLSDIQSLLDNSS